VRLCVVGEFRISYGKMGPTEIRVIAILINTLMYFAGPGSLEFTLGAAGRVAINIYDALVVVITLLLLSFFVSTGSRQARLLARQKE